MYSQKNIDTIAKNNAPDIFYFKNKHSNSKSNSMRVAKLCLILATLCLNFNKVHSITKKQRTALAILHTLENDDKLITNHINQSFAMDATMLILANSALLIGYKTIYPNETMNGAYVVMGAMTTTTLGVLWLDHQRSRPKNALSIEDLEKKAKKVHIPQKKLNEITKQYYSDIKDTDGYHDNQRASDIKSAIRNEILMKYGHKKNKKKGGI